MTGLHGSVSLLVPFVLVAKFAVLDFGSVLFFDLGYVL
jgi:hypothetical protein